MWQVSSGWSHSLAWGVCADGQLVIVGWGRCDMGQIPHSPVESLNQSLAMSVETSTPPVQLLMLPNQLPIVEIWCGSEYSIVADVEGHVWGCGWNEHGEYCYCI